MVKGKGRDGRNGPAPHCSLPPYLLRKALVCWHEIANKEHSLKRHKTCRHRFQRTGTGLRAPLEGTMRGLVLSGLTGPTS